MSPLQKHSLKTGMHVRLRISDAARANGYDKFQDDTVVVFIGDASLPDGRQYAKVRFRSGSERSVLYDFIVEIMRTNYEVFKERLIGAAQANGGK